MRDGSTTLPHKKCPEIIQNLCEIKAEYPKTQSMFANRSNTASGIINISRALEHSLSQYTVELYTIWQTLWHCKHFDWSLLNLLQFCEFLVHLKEHIFITSLNPRYTGRVNLLSYWGNTSHCRVAGNEAADFVAQQAANINNTDDIPNTPGDLKCLISSVWNKYGRDNWQF